MAYHILDYVALAVTALKIVMKQIIKAPKIVTTIPLFITHNYKFLYLVILGIKFLSCD